MSDWEPGRWWQVIYADGRVFPEGHSWAGSPQVWCESSDEQEVRASLETCPGGGVLRRLYERRERKWREVD